MPAEPAGADDDAPTWASGLLPPDGSAWPPAPVSPVPAPAAPEDLPSTPRRPADAEIDDWRTMPIDSPGGYQGSATAPPPPAPRTEEWSVAAAACALIAAAALVGVSVIGAAVLLMPFMAIAFGITGRKACSLDSTLRGRPIATLAVVAGVVELVVGLGFGIAGRYGLLGLFG